MPTLNFTGKKFDQYALSCIEKIVKEHSNIRSQDLDFFEAILHWEDTIHKESYFNGSYCYYIVLLVDLIKILEKILINNATKKEEYQKNYISISYFQEMCYLLVVNNVEIDQYIYMMIHYHCLPESINHQLGDHSKEQYIERKNAINFILNCQQDLEKNELTTDHHCYLKYKPKELLEVLLPSFIENIYDIPKDSILWETPLLKETMANYEALKKYAEERGWL